MGTQNTLAASVQPKKGRMYAVIQVKENGKANFLGHSDLSTTANIYAHLDKASKQASANIITGILNKAKD